MLPVAIDDARSNAQRSVRTQSRVSGDHARFPSSDRDARRRLAATGGIDPVQTWPDHGARSKGIGSRVVRMLRHDLQKFCAAPPVTIPSERDPRKGVNSPGGVMHTLVDHAVLERIRAEYLEMPGLSLKADQVQRLCGVEREQIGRAHV